MAVNKFQGGVRVKGKIKLPDESINKAIIIDASGDVSSSGTSSAELGHLVGVTSAVQTQLGDKASASDLSTHTSSTSNPHSVTKSQVGLSDVDNTSDASKNSAAVTLTNKTITAPLGIVKADVGLSDVNNTADTAKPISSATQTALDAKADLVSGKIPTSQIPALSIIDTYVVASQSAMLALTAQKGDVAVRSDESKTYILQGTVASTLSNWVLLQSPASAVISVNEQTGVVVLAKADVGLGNVDNTSDATKNSAAVTLTNKTITSPLGIVKADVGLGNVDNTSDATKATAVVSFTNKTIDADLNTITNIENADIKAGAAIDASKIANASVSNDEFQYLDGVTSGIQSQLDTKSIKSNGDIAETSFSAADDVSVAANVTGLAFAAGSVRSFKVLVSVALDATADLFEAFELIGINKGASFEMGGTSVGDDSGLTFSITSAGQIQYTSLAKAGFASNTVKFRAFVTVI